MMDELLDSPDAPLETGLFNIQMSRLCGIRLGIPGPYSLHQYAHILMYERHGLRILTERTSYFAPLLHISEPYPCRELT